MIIKMLEGGGGVAGAPENNHLSPFTKKLSIKNGFGS
jgi:hypothetical protein